MKIKTKLAIATGTLLLFIALLSALAIRQVHLLSDDTKNILEANYISLDYTRNMHKLLDKPDLSTNDIAAFETLLQQHNANMTEAGEQELTLNLKNHFNLNNLWQKISANSSNCFACSLSIGSWLKKPET